MTALTLIQGRTASGWPAFRPQPIALGAVVLAGLVSLSSAAVPVRPVPTFSARVVIAPVHRASLVAATSGEEAAIVQATGDAAEKINAALPFSSAPIQAARPFALGGNVSDHDRALTCLTQAVYYEAGFEPLAGRRAVAQVVLNRMRHPAFPKSICGVVYQGANRPGCQFSFVCDGSLWRAPAPAAWAEARRVAAAALAGSVEPVVGQATHYHADYVAPRWAPLLAKVSRIGAHIFYRWPGSWGTTAAFTGRYIGEPQDPASLRPAFRPAAPVGASAPIVLAAEEAAKGPPVARASNDVGGLLDTSKGWTLDIPLPAATGTAAARIAAQQSTGPARPSAAALAVASVAPASAGGN